MKSKRKVRIERVDYMFPPDKKEGLKTSSKTFEEFVYPWYPKCTSCRKSMGNMDMEYSDYFCYPVSKPLEAMWNYDPKDFKQGSFNPNSLDNIIEDYFEPMVVIEKEYNSLYKKEIERRYQKFQPNMCITCFRELTNQNDTWFDISLPTNTEKLHKDDCDCVYCKTRLKVVYPKGHPKHES